MIRYVCLFFISISAYSQEYKNKLVYEIDWLYGQSAIQVKYDRKTFNEITSSQNIAIVVWATDSAESLSLAPMWNKMAKILKKDYELIAYNFSDDPAFIRRFKKFLFRDMIEPKVELEKFLENFKFVIDLDSTMPKGIFSDKVPALVLIKDGKIFKKMYTTEQMNQYYKTLENKKDK